MSPTLSLSQTTPKKRILVVDDQPSATLLVRQCLEQADGYEVREENNVRKAEAAAQEFRPHLILLDFRMPGLDGGELAGRIRATPELSAVPIIFLTSLVTREEIATGKGWAGKFPMLAKPIVLSELVACLRQHLGD